MPLSRRRVLKHLGMVSAANLIPGFGFAAEAERWKLTTFQLDVTPPVGHPLLGSFFAPATSVRDPLEARGFVLTGPDQPIVVLAIDWCELRNDAFERWRTVLAEAAGTTPQRVLVQTVHQHDAPYFDLTAQVLLNRSSPGGRMLDPAFHEDCVQRTATEVKASLLNSVAVTHIGAARARVLRLASSRRVNENGKVSYRRYSRCTETALRDLPEGEIDPWLMSISFWNGDTELASLSAYACHPMSYYGEGEISGDFPNMARAIRSAAGPKRLQIYATGCCGDVTAGKYNDGSKGNRALFAERLAQAMTDAATATKKSLLERISFRNEAITLPHSELESMSETALRTRLNDDQLPLNTRVQAALGLSSLTQNPGGHRIDIPMIDFGPAQLVLLPAESFVAYQLFAQQQRTDSLVMTLGFGQSAPGYIPTDQAFREGFREEHGYTWTRPGAEAVIQRALKALLAR